MNILDDESSKDKYNNSEHLKYIKDSTVWMKFVGITVKVICVMTFLSTMIQIVRSALTTTKTANLFPYLMLLTIIGFIYYIFDLVHKSAEFLEKYFRTSDEDSLKKGLEYQQKYWKAAGYLTIIYITLIVMLILIGLIMGAMKQ
jgi:hypothetical protein